MERFYNYKLGSLFDREYLLSVNGSPSLDEIEEFAVTIYYNKQDGSTVQIARIDTAHDRPHFDMLHRRDNPKPDFDGGVYDAEEKLRNNWRRFAETHEKNHGGDE